MCRILGVDLTEVDGLDSYTVAMVIGEIGTDMSAWPTIKHFTSWLGLCPGNKISGGKVLSSRTKPCANKAAAALRIAAQTLYRSQSALRAFLRRKKYHLGPAQAITATAHKLARIIYSLLRDGGQYTDEEAAAYEARFREVCQKLQVSTGAASQHLELERQAILAERRNTANELANLTNFIKRVGAKAPKHLADEISQLERRVAGLNSELSAKDQAIRDAAPVEADPSLLRTVFKRLGNLLEKATLAEQQELLRLFVQRIEITRDGIVLHVYELPDGDIARSKANHVSSKTNIVWSG